MLTRFGFVFGEDVAGGVEAVEGGGEAGVNGHLDHQLDDLLLRTAHFKRGVEMGAKLQLGAASGDERNDGGDFTGLQIEGGAG